MILNIQAGRMNVIQSDEEIFFIIIDDEIKRYSIALNTNGLTNETVASGLRVLADRLEK